MRITRNLWLLSITSLLNDISSEMVYPLLGFILTGHLGATPTIVGIIEGLAESTASLLKFSFGRWSDRIKQRKPFAVGGYGISMLGKVVLAFAGAWPMALTGRVMDRFGKGIRNSPRDALIAESVPPEQRGRAFGFHRSMDTVGAAIGVAIAWILFTQVKGDDQYLYELIMWVAVPPAALGVLALLLVRESRPEPMKDQSAPKPKPPFHPMLAWRALPSRLRAFLIVAIVFALAQSSDIFLLMRLHDAGATIPQVLLIYFGFNIFGAVAGYPAGWLSDHLGRRLVLLTGMLLYAAVYGGFAFLFREGNSIAATLTWGAILMAGYGLSKGCTDGVTKALLADQAPADNRASIIGLHDMLVGLTLFPASWIAGVMWQQFGVASPFWFGGGCAMVAAIALVFVLPGGASKETRHA